MKKYLRSFTICLLSLAMLSAQSSVESSNDTTELFFKIESQLRREELNIINVAKIFLINGNLTKAKRALNKISKKSKVASTIKERYLAIIEFISGDYKSSLNHLLRPDMNAKLHYKEFCLLKILNYLLLNKTSKLRGELNKCYDFVSAKANDDLVWIKILAELAFKNPLALNGQIVGNVLPFLNDIKSLRMWLKLVLLLGVQDQVEEEFGLIPAYYYKSKSFRELLAIYYYRQKKFKKALALIEDINSANAQNIRANMFLSEKKYELAYGHLKLALKRKQNSQNALERGIALAWILEKYRDGWQMATKLQGPSPDTVSTGRKRQALRAAFLSRLKKHNLAFSNLRSLDEQFRENLPLEVEQLHAYNALETKDRYRLGRYSDLACKKYDGLSCWIQLQMSIWEDIIPIVNRSGAIDSSDELNFGDLKKVATIIPLEGPKIIDQQDIEELDDL